MRLDPYDIAIIRYLGKKGNSNTNDIANVLKISWKTANEHLLKLKRMRFVINFGSKKSTDWALNR